jgi:hypothetical protein
MWTFQVQKSFDIILINMGSHKFNKRHVRHEIEFRCLFLDSKSQE